MEATASPLALTRHGPTAPDRTSVAGASELVEQYHDILARVCFVITGDADLAADAVQDTWDMALRKLDRLRRPESVKSWLVTIAANQARQQLRRRRRRDQRLSPLQEVPSHQEQQPVSSDPDLTAALGRLTSLDRQLLSLDFAAGLSSGEIGTIMGLSAEGVRSRKHRLLRNLRKELS